MVAYNVTNADSALAAVEFTPVSDGNFSFFTVRTPDRKEEIKQWLVSGLNQEIIAETTVDGKPMLVAHGDLSKEDLMKKLEEHGDKLQMRTYKKPFNYWAARGTMSIVGQTLQLASAFLQVEKLAPKDERLSPTHAHYNPKLKEGMYVRKGFSADIGLFAILNLAANIANILYGGQQEKGTNRLRHIKDELNITLEEHLAPGDTLLGLEDNRAQSRHGPKAPPTAIEKFDDFARENSVRFFEIGLRFVAAAALVFPFNRFGKGLAALKEGAVIKAIQEAKNPNALTMWSGIGYLTGKTMALFAKTPDPYDTTPHTTWDDIREKHLFKLGGLIEAVAGGAIGYNAYTSKKIGVYTNKTADITPYRDYLGTIGGALFAGGYLVRLGAPFGTKHVDMEEVYAHATDTLAKTPPGELPQLMADTAATLKEHFKDKQGLEYSQIFTKMMTDMYRYHHIALDNLGTEPEERNAKILAKCMSNVPGDQRSARTMARCLDGIPNSSAHPPTTADLVSEPAGKYALANAPKRPSERVSAPAGSYAEKTGKSSDTPSIPQVGV